MRKLAATGVVGVFALAAVLVAGGAATDSFAVRLITETNNTITLGWSPQPGYGYLFSRDGQLVSRTYDASRSSVKFSKGTSYDIDVITKGANGHYPEAAPPPPPPPTDTGGTTTTTPQPPPTGAFPNSANTGPDAAPDYPGSLKQSGSTGCELPIVSNKTYRFCSFGSVGVGSTANPVSNVTFYGCRFKAVEVENALVILFGTRNVSSGITFDYSSFEPGVAAPPTPYGQSYQYGIEASGSYGSFVGKLVVDHSDIWGFGNAINVKGSDQANPQVFRNNWIHDSAQDGGSYHTDGIGNTTDSGNDSYVTIDHNTIVAAGNTNGIAFQRGTYHHFTVTNNLLGGFGFTTAIWATGSHDIVFTGNTYTTALKPVFGPLYPQAFWTTAGSTWRNNRWLVPAGAAWGNPSHSGWYWLPNTSTIDGQSSPSDSPFVSQTDYTG